MTPAPGLEPARAKLIELIRRHGGSVSHALLDPTCSTFQLPGVNGVVGYRPSWGCAVALGDPVCQLDDTATLFDAFRAYCRRRGWRTIYAVASERLAALAAERGYASLLFGEELIFDLRRERQQGPEGRELRKKVRKAERQEVFVSEYRPDGWRDEDLERAMERVSSSWLAARRGPQIYLADIRLFTEPAGKRWFYAGWAERIVGVLNTVELEARQSHLIDHVLATPDAPSGTSELLVARTLETLGAEGCRCATFGPAPSLSLGPAVNLGRVSEALARAAYNTAARIFHLDARTRYRRKFQVDRSEPSYLLFDPPQLGPREVMGVLRAFNLSLPHRQLSAPDESDEKARRRRRLFSRRILDERAPKAG